MNIVSDLIASINAEMLELENAPKNTLDGFSVVFGQSTILVHKKEEVSSKPTIINRDLLDFSVYIQTLEASQDFELRHKAVPNSMNSVNKRFISGRCIVHIVANAQGSDGFMRVYYLD